MIPRSTSLACALPLLLALAACKPAAERSPADDASASTPPAAETEATPEATAGTDVNEVIHHAPKDPAGFDRKAFAGTYAGTLPCADCPGIDTRIEFTSDGAFKLTETYQERGVTSETAGTWSIGDDGRKLLLDPDTKEASDRWFEIVSAGEIRALDIEGNPIDSTLDYSLRRD